jgi:acyl phosphate:glycerol-3-phosphate acyltransferase
VTITAYTLAAMEAVLLGYLIGSLPLGLLVARGVTGVDPRHVGSGNLGATNVYRTSGWGLGLTVMALDMAKGIGAVLLAGRSGAAEGVTVAAGVAAVVGHVFPVWLRFRGGKGVATACGAFWVLAPLATALAAFAFIAMVAATRVVSAGSLVATLTLPSVALVSGAPTAVTLGATLTAALITWRHRGNIQRIWRGTEQRLGRSRTDAHA